LGRGDALTLITISKALGRGWHLQRNCASLAGGFAPKAGKDGAVPRRIGGARLAWRFESECITIGRFDDLQDPESTAVRSAEASRNVPRAIACLLIGVCQLCAAGRGNAQESVPRDIRSKRATENPIPLVEQKGDGMTFPLNATTEVFGNLAGGTRMAPIWESVFIAGMEADFERAAGALGLSLSMSGLYAEGPA
jgi:hypothetical protein